MDEHWLVVARQEPRRSARPLLGGGDPVTWSDRAKGFVKGGLVLLALAVAFFLAVGVLELFHRSACGRLDAERVSHLLPGHTTRGPHSIYVIGIEPGPPPSQITQYWEAVSAMQEAGCDVPGEDQLP